MTALWLGLAIVFEAGWALCLKSAAGGTARGLGAGSVLAGGVPRGWWIASTLVLYVASVAMLGLAVRRMEIGTAYAIWAGSGMVLIALGAWGFYGESLSWRGWCAIGVIALGVAWLEVERGWSARAFRLHASREGAAARP